MLLKWGRRSAPSPGFQSLFGARLLSFHLTANTTALTHFGFVLFINFPTLTSFLFTSHDTKNLKLNDVQY
jgi:hypothetical protein